ncbi:MAG TPA: PhzF family phenazine biosynthesis isomerase [Nocardioidaceae bacterium]|nr:PhzF family phenazine biosynthesis isomerase [Nocardioidaceae bacterium]
MEILRYTAFSTDPDGGNPAGVVLDSSSLTPEEMQLIATEVGYSETAFLAPRPDGGLDMRYFSPRAEVPFCGHATIAAAVAHAERHGEGERVLQTAAGEVPVETRRGADGQLTATLTSVRPRVDPLDSADVDRLLRILGWPHTVLDGDLPPHVTYAGAQHPVIAVSDRSAMEAMSYDFASLDELTAERGWTTVNVVWRESGTTFRSRNAFPPGGVVEDPATGAAAAALGGYLRALGLVEPPVRVTVHQGHEMGRPSTLLVDVPAGTETGIAVSGNAVPMPGIG